MENHVGFLIHVGPNVVYGIWQSMAESQNPAIPAALWRHHRGIFSIAASPKTATDFCHGTAIADIQ